MAYKKLERKPLTMGERLYLPAVASGLKLTLKHFFGKTVTTQYPEEKLDLPEYYRGAPVLVKDEDGREKCVACCLCEYVCPPKAIRIEPGPIDSDVERGPRKFEINMLRCIFCGLCEEACPEEAIFMSHDYELCGTSRDEMVHDKAKLYERGGVREGGVKKWEGRGKVKTIEHLEAGH